MLDYEKDLDERRQSWEVLLDAASEGRRLTRDELDLLDEAEVRVAIRRGLCEEKEGRRRIVWIHDEARERAWYEDDEMSVLRRRASYGREEGV